MLDVIVQLNSLGLTARDAAAIARELVESPNRSVKVSASLSVVYDPALQTSDLGARLRDAAERVVPRRRGRPAGRAGPTALDPTVRVLRSARD